MRRLSVVVDCDDKFCLDCRHLVLDDSEGYCHLFNNTKLRDAVRYKGQRPLGDYFTRCRACKAAERREQMLITLAKPDLFARWRY